MDKELRMAAFLCWNSSGRISIHGGAHLYLALSAVPCFTKCRIMLPNLSLDTAVIILKCMYYSNDECMNICM